MKIGIYARVSTDKQTIDNQLNQLRNYVKLRSWDLVDEYLDDGFTGRNTNRPELQRLMKDVKRGRIKAVLVWKLDRIGRSTQDNLQILNYFRNHSCGFVSFSENIDITTSTGKMVYTFLSALAEAESDRISERTKAAYQFKKSRAENLGKKVKWGRKEKKFTDKEVFFIEEMIRLKISWRKIAETLNKSRETENENLPKDKQLPNVSYSTIRRMFQNRGGAT